MVASTIISQLAKGEPELAAAAGGAVFGGISSGIDQGMKLRGDLLDQKLAQQKIQQNQAALNDWEMKAPVRELELNINKDRLLEEYSKLPLEFQAKTQEQLSKLDSADTDMLKNDLFKTKEAGKLFFDIKNSQDYTARKEAFPEMFKDFGFTGDFSPEVKQKMDTLARVSAYSEKYIQDRLSSAEFDPKSMATFGKDEVASSMYLMKNHPDAGVRAAAEGAVMMSIAGKMTKTNAPVLAKVLYPGDDIKQEALLKWVKDRTAPAPRAAASAGAKAAPAKPKEPVYKAPVALDYKVGLAAFSGNVLKVDGENVPMRQALGMADKKDTKTYNDTAGLITAGVTGLAHKLAWQESTYLNRNTTTSAVTNSIYTFLMNPKTGFQEEVRDGWGIPGISGKKIVLNTGVLQNRLELFEASWLQANGASIAAWKQMQTTGAGAVPPAQTSKVTMSPAQMEEFRKARAAKTTGAK